MNISFNPQGTGVRVNVDPSFEIKLTKKEQADEGRKYENFDKSWSSRKGSERNKIKWKKCESCLHKEWCIYDEYDGYICEECWMEDFM